MNRYALLFIAYFASGTCWAADPFDIKFPDTPPPSGSNWSWVGRQMVVDGTPMAIKVFDYRGTESDLIVHFENYWKTLSHGNYRRNQIGPKSFLTHETTEFYSSVQYEVKGDTISGAITISSPALDKVRVAKPPVKLPPGARTISRIDSNDLGIYSLSVTQLSNRSVNFNADYFMNQLQNDGWVRVSYHCTSVDCNTQYQSELGQLQISIKELPGVHGSASRILVHLIKQ